MFNFAYCTADQVGRLAHGGGQVTGNEYSTLCSMGSCVVLGRQELQDGKEVIDPWGWDDISLDRFCSMDSLPKLVHFYAGCFTKTINYLKSKGIVTSFTSAAHDKDLSRQEHERLGLPFPYPHLTEPELWQRYLQGYLDADLLIVPSQLSKRAMLSYGAKNRIEVIPHGTTIPDESKLRPLPKQFVVGYMGAIGADKGIPYLLEAWKKLNYKDAVLKLAGGNSHSPWMQHLINTYGGSNISCLGWIDDPADFYGSISLYVQPSVSEGFGISVLEAMSYGRPVICSDGAGASDLVMEAGAGAVSFSRDVQHLADMIDAAKKNWDLERLGLQARERSLNYSWESIREKYAVVWRELLGV